MSEAATAATATTAAVADVEPVLPLAFESRSLDSNSDTSAKARVGPVPPDKQKDKRASERRLALDRKRELVAREEREFNQETTEYRYRMVDAAKFVFDPQQFGLTCQAEASRIHKRLLSSINTDEIMLMDPYFMRETAHTLAQVALRDEITASYHRVWAGHLAEMREKPTESSIPPRPHPHRPNPAAVGRGCTVRRGPFSGTGVGVERRIADMDLCARPDISDELDEAPDAAALFLAAQRKLLQENALFNGLRMKRCGSALVLEDGGLGLRRKKTKQRQVEPPAENKRKCLCLFPLVKREALVQQSSSLC